MKKIFALYWTWSRRDFGGRTLPEQVSAIVPKSGFTFGLKKLTLPSKRIYQGIDQVAFPGKRESGQFTVSQAETSLF